MVIASHNQGKVREISHLLSEFKYQVLSCGDLGVTEPEETGLTFADNSLLKARHTSEKLGLVALADDSGLAVDVLDGAPGIYSARWGGESKDFNAAMQKVKDEIESKGLEAEGQAARFICSLCMYYPDGEFHHFDGVVRGRLTFPPRLGGGFGYDPIFIPHGYIITFSEMDDDRKNLISHRARAFQLFKSYIAGA